METARNQILWSDYNKDDSLQASLYDLFNAKVATEVIQAVGYRWNWRILLAGKPPEPLPDEIDKIIDKLWIEHNLSPFSKKSRTPTETIEEWRKKVISFAASALSAGRRKSK